jgi:hypothetical protein
MKQSLLILLSSLAFTLCTIAGPVTPAPAPVPAPNVFTTGFSVELGGTWTNQPATSALPNSHGLGGEIGIAYWFMPQLGARLSADLSALSPSAASFTGDIITRVPITGSAWAPYAFAGAGLATLGSPNGLYHAGGEVEYQFSPQLSLFGEASRAVVNQTGTTTPVAVTLGLRYSR